MGKKQNEEKVVVCPVGRFFMDLEKASARRSKFFEHLDRSKVEFLKALRSVLDESIEAVEKKERSGREKKATRINIEEA
jgi:hypothetical protein